MSFFAQLPGVTVYVRRPDYEAELVPKVRMVRPRLRLVPAFTWTPPTKYPSGAHGRIRALPSFRQYLLYGAHLTVATIRVSINAALDKISGRETKDYNGHRSERKNS